MEWLKKIRLEKGLTHDDIARGVGIQRAYFTMIENGRKRPSVDIAKKIGNLLGFDWTRFFEVDPE